MNAAALRLLCLIFCLFSALSAPMPAQEKEEVNPWKAPPAALPDAVLRARVQARKVTVFPDGGSLATEVIAPPALPAATSTPVPAAALPDAAAPASATSPATRAKASGESRRITELNLFSPAITVYEGTGISRVTWWGGKGLQEFSALVRLDLTSIGACGDLVDGDRRWLLFPSVSHGSARFSPKEKFPSLTDFQRDTDIILTRGDAADKQALEPLMLLLEKYDTEGGLIASTAAAMKADREAREAWEKAHPEKPEQVVIKMWPVRSTEYPTAKTAGQ